MTKLLLILLLTTSALAGGRKAPAPEPSPSPSAVPSPIPAPSPQLPGIHFESVAYYTTVAERAKIKSAAQAVARTLASQCFKDFMSTRNLIQTNGKTPPQVVEHIRGLAGTVPIEMYYRRFTSAVAYRNPGSPTIHLNRKAFGTSMPDCEWSSTMAHEALHVFDYDHDFKWSASRDFSVPYSVNKAFEACCK